MFETTTDKILKILIDNENLADVSQKIHAVKISLPHLSDKQIFSAIADLSKNDLIATLYGSGELIALNVKPYALSRLTDKRAFKIFNFNLDLIKIAFGYGLGFISAWLLK